MTSIGSAVDPDHRMEAAMTDRKTTLRAVPESHASTGDRYGRQTAAVLILLVMLGALQMLFSQNIAQSEDAAASLEPIPAEIAPANYLPAQYVNQAQHSQPEEHIQAF
jgi:hypothetical protein